MQELINKLEELSKAIQAVNPKPIGFRVPKLPSIKPPASAPMKSAGGGAKMPGLAPEAKKDPRKIAEQINSGKMSTKTQKVMLKSHANGQWYLD